MKIHRVWLGSTMPEKFAQYGEEWKQLNDAELIDWTDEMVWSTEWINQNVLDHMRRESEQPNADPIAFYTHVADVIGYETIYKHGGWYFNCDLKPLKPLSFLGYNPDAPAFAYEDDDHLVNMAMYCPAGDPLMGNIIANLAPRYFSMPGAFMNASTGVQLIMQCIGNYLGPLTTFPRNVFNPVHWSQFDYGEEPNINREFPDESVAVHLWAHRTNQRGQRILN